EGEVEEVHRLVVLEVSEAATSDGGHLLQQLRVLVDDEQRAATVPGQIAEAARRDGGVEDVDRVELHVVDENRQLADATDGSSRGQQLGILVEGGGAI